jgi:hypothetical protein
MNADNWIMRGTAWFAFALYVAAEMIPRRDFPGARKMYRWLSSLGCAALLAHIGCAFQYRHGWSHSAAYADTARQTAALTGWNWGGGIYLNYFFALVWFAEVVRLWSNRTPELRRGWRVHIVRGFFLFMFLNAAVIFVHSPARWIGLALCLVLVVGWVFPRTLAEPPFFAKRSD